MRRPSKNIRRFFKTENLKKIAHVFIVLVFIFSSVSFVRFASGSPLDGFTGFAWGADWVDHDSDGNQDPEESPTGGIGHISFNCTTGGPKGEDACNNSNYGVNVDPNNNLVGYAWTDTYGWIRFGGFKTADFPTGFGTEAVNAKFIVDPDDPTKQKLIGWAKFCSVALNPGNCLGNSFKNASNGNWDGWLSMSGTGYKVSLDDSGVLSGYAWGGNDNGSNVVGWVDFNGVEFNPIEGPKVSLTAGATLLPDGGETTLEWTGKNLDSPDKCTASGSTNTGAWLTPPEKSSPDGTFDTGVLTVPFGKNSETYTYKIQCKGLGGDDSNLSEVEIKVVKPVVEFYADPAIAPKSTGYKTTIWWNTIPDALGCTADGATGNITPATDWDGPVPTNPPPSPYDPPYSKVVFIPNNKPKTELKITCVFDSQTSVSKTIYVSREQPNESISLKNTKVESDKGNPPVYTTTLSWTTKNIKPGSCEASTDDPANTNWEDTKQKSDPSGSMSGVIVPPKSLPEFTTFTLTCTGADSGNKLYAELELTKDSGAKEGKWKYKQI